MNLKSVSLSVGYLHKEWSAMRLTRSIRVVNPEDVTTKNGTDFFLKMT